MPRTCGACSVCCEVAEVPELGKPALTACEFQTEYVAEAGCCKIFGESNRPQLCVAYQCAWLQGIGSEDARPDQIGAMFSVNRTERGRIGFAVETVPDAIMTTAREMAVHFVRQTNLPLVVSEYMKKTAGEWVVVLDGEMTERSWAMRGGLVARLDSDVGMYDRVDPPAGVG